MLVELAIGDAYGAGFEYVNKKVVKEHNNLQQYIQHPRHLSIKPGCYTDDTQMSLAVAELLISDDEWMLENIANYFVNAFKRDPREGYASRFYQFLTDISDGKQFLEQIKPYSDKSGAAMRAGPIGLLADEKQIVEYATIQAKVTHDTPGGVNSAVAAALMVHYCQYQLGDKQDLGNYLKSKVPGDWNTPWQGKIGHLGVDATHAAVAAIISHQDLSAILKQCVDYTGDVDTVATIALAAASCSQEVNQDLPEVLYSELENGQFGLKYLQKLDQNLKNILIL
ncbi:ADP-ribosylglycohydrolase family protein [Endozoicomonas sp. SM1973]|uniref:ADP-ribosylglycohydrolase family protein n=1 Tax=Spartinivicinus marinus TaxID=2994442 RepID=A0A853ILP3_9GAMM|nr:ADP-ribosylglycohydrolase family protein [Spartinivicinus marinus]MCX4025860.1 ADP-ribosylglycohydrolase family protein [Spartinivicinus marinus]NYZ68676.1 ADP-ribosylglycohydrolase family protein [Spartinivicinus marinus]